MMLLGFLLLRLLLGPFAPIVVTARVPAFAGAAGVPTSSAAGIHDPSDTGIPTSIADAGVRTVTDAAGATATGVPASANAATVIVAAVNELPAAAIPVATTVVSAAVIIPIAAATIPIAAAASGTPTSPDTASPAEDSPAVVSSIATATAEPSNAKNVAGTCSQPPLSTLIIGSSMVRHITLKGAETMCYPGALISDIDHLLLSILEQVPSANRLLSKFVIFNNNL